MLKVLFLVIISVVMLNQVNGQSNNGQKFNSEKLSPNGQKAYQNLLETLFFIEPVYHNDEELPAEIKSFNILLDEKHADEAFKSLLKDGAIAGQLYALCGVYYTDNEFFKESVEKYKDSETMVVRVNKDLKFWFKIDSIIELTDGNIAIIPPNETIQDWWKKVKGGYVIDIVHGGFPATFRRYKDFGKDKK